MDKRIMIGQQGFLQVALVLLTIGAFPAARADVTLTGDAVVDQDNVAYVGQSGTGTMVVDNGEELDLFAIFVAPHPDGEGEVVIQDPGTIVNLYGTHNRFGIGEQGIGTLSVLNGAVLDGSVAPQDCDGSVCNFFVGNAAGASGSLKVSGTGSVLRTMTSLVAGGAAVFSQGNDGFDMGIPGASTYASIEISNNAQVESASVNLSGGPGGGSPTGEEQTFVTVEVSDASIWEMSSLHISSNSNAHADFHVRSGSVVSIDDFFTVGFDESSEPNIVIEGGGQVSFNQAFFGPSPGSRTRLTINAGTFSGWGAVLGNQGALVMEVSDGGEVTLDNYLFVSRLGGSSARVQMGPGALLSAPGVVALGYNFLGQDAGECLVVMRPGSIIRSNAIVVGPECMVVGRGRIEGTLYNLGRVGKGIDVVP